ncbi:MAG: pilin [Patescibacteria group bacterium]
MKTKTIHLLIPTILLFSLVIASAPLALATQTLPDAGGTQTGGEGGGTQTGEVPGGTATLEVTPPAPGGAQSTTPADIILPNFLAKTPGEQTDINVVIGRIIKSVIGVSGSIALAVFIYGGVLWMFSGGSEGRIDKGKKAMLYAAIGLAVIFLSYTLVSFVLRALQQ